MTTYFSAEPRDIDDLPEKTCVQIFGEMLRAEAIEIGIPVTSVTIADSSVPDGGIDAHVNCESPEGGHLIVGNCPSYQIKAGKNFEPWQKAEIYSELFGGKEPKKENLKTEIRRGLENGCTYILACMKIDRSKFTVNRRHDAENHVKDAVVQCGLPVPTVEVWGQDQILSCLNRFPSIALRVNGRGGGKVLSHQIWSAQNDMQKPLKLQREHEVCINAIRDKLRGNSKPIHVNVYGETGVGKTRLVLEATKDLGIRPLVVYCGSPRLFYDSPLNEIRQNEMSAVLVIDDCNRDEIWERVREMSSKIKLVTIGNEKRKIMYTEQLEAPRLGTEKIREIILGYCGDYILAGQLAPMCGGIPRFAHIVGFDAQNNPDDLLGRTDMGGIFTRYIRHGDEPDSEETKQTERMLLTIALFKRFGHGQYFIEESRAVLQLIQKLDPAITPAFFEETIRKLKDRKILQGEETLYLTPKYLHVWLWARWWDKYMNAPNLDEILNGMPQSLADSFFDMFEYARQSPGASAMLKRFFGESGPLRDSKMLRTTNGSKLFHALSRVDPLAAVRHLENTMGRWTGSELQNFTEGRRHVISGLERIMFEPDLFIRGGRLLRSLAEAENEDWSNNSTGIFCDMFSLGTGYLSNTKTPPQTRLPLLKETLCDLNSSRRSLGLKACKSALAIKFASLSSLGHDDFDLDVKGWEPANVMQWQESYQDVIDLLHAKIKVFPADAQLTAAKIFLDQSRSLLRQFPDMSGYLADTISELRSVASDEAVLSTVMEIIEFDRDRIGPDAIARLERIAGKIEGHSYSSLMKRYVRMDIMVDVLSKDHEQSREVKIKELARESVDIGKLRLHLEWLVTRDAKYGGVFGYELALQDTSESLLPEILDAQRNTGEDGSGFFLSGYMTAILQKDVNRWNEIMREIANDEKLLRFFVELSWRSGITDEIGILMLELVRNGRLPSGELAKIVPGFPNKPSSTVVRGWIKAMLEDGRPESIYKALKMFYSLFTRRKIANSDASLALDLLTRNAFLKKDGEARAYPLADYYWKEIALEHIEQHPENSLILGDKILESMDSVSLASHAWMREVLNKIASESPNEMWNMAVRYIGKHLDEHGYAVLSWMRGGIAGSNGELLGLIDHERVFDWIDSDPHYRALHMARFSPPLLQKGSLAMELLKRYGEDDRVGQSLLASFLTGFFSGSAVEHYTEVKGRVLEYKEGEENGNINRWLDSYLEILDERIKKEAVLEERLDP